MPMHSGRGHGTGAAGPLSLSLVLAVHLPLTGEGNPPVEGDELPQEWQKKPGRKVANGRDSASKRRQKKRAAVK